MKNLTIAFMTLSLLACGGPADPVDAGATATSSATSDRPAPGSTPPGAAKSAVNAPAPPARDAGIDPAQFETVRRYTTLFYEGEIDTLFGHFSEGMVESFPIEQLSTLHEQVGERFGKEISVLGEETKTNDDYRGFVRWARFDKTEEIIEVQWILNADDEVAGFFVRPAQKKMESKAVPMETPR